MLHRLALSQRVDVHAVQFILEDVACLDELLFPYQPHRYLATVRQRHYMNPQLGSP